jgi:hypothetical protein
LNLLHKSCTIGRDPKACIVIKKDTVSREHAKIIVTDDIIYLVHLSKTQVTKINPGEEDEEVIQAAGEHVELMDGDIIDISGRFFRYDGLFLFDRLTMNRATRKSRRGCNYGVAHCRYRSRSCL